MGDIFAKLGVDGIGFTPLSARGFLRAGPSERGFLGTDSLERGSLGAGSSKRGFLEVDCIRHSIKRRYKLDQKLVYNY